MAFLSSSLQGAPPGLERLLRGFNLKAGETSEEGRGRFYRRIFGILWVSNSDFLLLVLPVRTFEAVLTFPLPFLPLFFLC